MRNITALTTAELETIAQIFDVRSYVLEITPENEGEILRHCRDTEDTEAFQDAELHGYTHVLLPVRKWHSISFGSLNNCLKAAILNCVCD